VSNIKRTVEQLFGSPEHRSRLFAVDLMFKNAHVFDSNELTDRLKLASLDQHPDVAKKAKLVMSQLLKQGLGDQAKIRELGIHSRMMNMSEEELLYEQEAREKAGGLLAQSMQKVVDLAKLGDTAVATESLAVIGHSCRVELAGELIVAAGDPARRPAALVALRSFRIPELGDLVSHLLDNAQSPEDHVAVAEILGEAGLESGAGTLATLLGHASEQVRAKAAEALGKVPGDEAEQALRTRVQDSSALVQTAVMKALGTAGRGTAVDPILEVFPKMAAPESQAAALVALGKLRSSRGAKLIVQSLTSSVPTVKLAAVEALGSTKMPADQVRSHLNPLLADPDLAVRASAIKALYPHDVEKAGEALRSMIASKKPPERAAAMSIMGDVQDPQAMETFLVALNTEQDRAVVASGLDAIDKIVDPRLVRSIQRLMTHPNPQIQEKAVRAYGRLSGSVGIRELDRLYDETRTDALKTTILSVLGTMCEAGNISAITKQLKSSDENVVSDAIDALDRVGSIENSMLLESYLVHQSAKVRAAAVVALFHTGNFRCLGTITDMLAQRDPGQQLAALSALKKIHASLRWAELQKRPLLQTPLMAKQPAGIKEASSTVKLDFSLTQGNPLRADVSRAIPRPTQKVAVERTTPEERAIVKAAQALGELELKAAVEMAQKVLAAEPGSELAQYVLQRALAGTPQAAPIPAEVLKTSSFLPLLGEETRQAKGARDTRRLLGSYFQVFERQLDVMRQVIAEGRDYLTRNQDAQAMEVAKFIVAQMQWTVDFDVRLGLICYDKQEWERAFTHLLRAFVASGGEAMIGVHLAAVAMKVKKRDLAKTLLGPILNGERTDPRVKERAAQVAQALAQAESPGPSNPPSNSGS
jgi:HEAT repeat protein